MVLENTWSDFIRDFGQWLTGSDGNLFDLFAVIMIISPLVFFSSVIVTWRSRHAIDEIICTDAQIKAFDCQSFANWEVFIFNFFWWTSFFFIGLQWTYLDTLVRKKIFPSGTIKRWDAKAWAVLLVFILIVLGILAY